MRRGELPSVNAHRGPRHAGKMQAAVAAAFLGLFVCTPFLGRRIARDDEFRQKWVPKWYDYTVQKPEKRPKPYNLLQFSAGKLVSMC